MERRRSDDDRGGRDRDDDRGSRSRDRDDDRRGSSRDRDDDRGGRDRERRGRDDDDRGGSRGGSRRSFEYQERDPSLAREREQSNSKFDQYLSGKIKMFKPNDGDNTIRLLPPTWDGAKHWGVDVWVHYGVGADRQTYLCLDKHDKGKCPVCAERRNFAKDADMDDDRDKEALKNMEPKQRVLVYVIDRDHEREGVMAWAMPQGLDSDIVKITKDKRTGEVLAIDHPDKGYDLSFEKNGSGMKTKYEAPAIARSSSSLGRDEWLEFAMENPLPEQLVFFDEDHIAREFGGVIGDRKEDKDKDRGGRDRDDKGGRDRDDRGRSRDRDDDRDRDRGRGDDRDRDRGGRDDRGSSRREEPTLTWESVHEMTARELDDLIESERLKINPKEAKDDEDLADWICDELKLTKSERRRTSSESPKGDDERLGKLRDRLRD